MQIKEIVFAPEMLGANPPMISLSLDETNDVLHTNVCQCTQDA